MANQKEIMSRDFRLNRKYLIVICFILLFMKIGGVSLESFSIFGAKFDIEKPETLYMALWVIFIYSAMRYWQFFNSESLGEFISLFKTVQNEKYRFRLVKLVNTRLKDGNKIRMTTEHTKEPRFIRYHQRFEKQGFFKRTYVPSNDTVTPTSETITINVVTDLWRQYITTWIYFVLSTPHFFSFALPFLMLILTIVICGFGEWEGAFTNFI